VKKPHFKFCNLMTC